MLAIDGHLDLAYNALWFNRDLKKSVAEVRAWEADMTGKGRACNTVCLPDMRRGEVFTCFATVCARHATGFKTSIDFSPEGAHAVAHGQLAYYRILERQGVLRQLTNWAGVETHLAAWQASPQTAPIGYVLCIEGADSLIEPSLVQ